MSTHTPAPWSTGGFFVDGDENTQWIWGARPKGMQSGAVVAKSVRSHDVRLIAAAPDLLTELRHVLSAYVLPERKTCGEAAQDGERIKALIARATGAAS